MLAPNLKPSDRVLSGTALLPVQLVVYPLQLGWTDVDGGLEIAPQNPKGSEGLAGCVMMERIL